MPELRPRKPSPCCIAFPLEPVCVNIHRSRSQMRLWTPSCVPLCLLLRLLIASLGPSRDTTLRATLAEALPNAGSKLTNASVAIVVCGDSTRMLKQQPEFWVQDCSAATENLLLAAHACGLGAVWCGLYPDMERVQTARTILRLDERYVPLCIIPVGYPSAPVSPKDKYREDAIIRR